MTGTGVSVGTGDGTPGRVLMALMTMNRPLMDINRCHNSLRQVQIIQKPVKDSSPASPARPSVHASPSRRSEAHARTVEPAPALNAMDSFILDVLRGWRLLVAASLSPEEWRDVLATTGNKLDYLSVSSALQTLWGEQLGGNGKWHSNVSSAPLSSFWHEGSWPYDAWSDNQAMWHDWNESEDWSSEAWEAAAATGEQPGPSDERVDDVTDPALIEALEAEKQAESLALEARRTWSQAQQATQQLQRDRGFGKSGSGSSSSNPIRCYLCGGPHLQKDCPDKHHPSFRKGYGKSLSQAELDAYLAGKSKGKGFKGKFKDGMLAWHDDGSWYSDSFMINKGKGKNPKGKYFKPSANVYGMDFYALEMMDVEDSPQTFHVFPLELFSTDETDNKRSTPPGYGMLDCGATASAGPEASAKRLISKLRLFDPDLKVCFNYNKRPYFRYGSGKWGQALYHAVIHSSWDSSRCFELYVLENPMEYNSEWFSDDMLVPILVGMDHLKKTGLILDFSDGHAVNGNDNPAVPYVMERNLKGHYMVNIAYYLFGSLSDSEAGGNESFAAQLLEQDCHSAPSEGDIRSQTTSWPCFGKHVSSNPKSNGYGQWRTCEICGVRLSYVPRAGYQGKSAAQACHKTVELAMKQLRQDLEPCGRFPTMDLVETMIQIITDESKIVATESTLKRLRSHVDTLKQTYADQMKSDTQAPKGSSTSPTDVWRFLSEQEKSKLMEIAMERHKEESADPVSQQPVIEDATKMSNFSWAYEIDNEQLFEEPYGNVDQCFLYKSFFVKPFAMENSQGHFGFLGMMTLAAQTGLRDFLQGDRVDGWEMFCAPDSWLTAACRTEGLRFSRINLQQGYDLYKTNTYELLKEKYKSEKPRRIWISTRCTYWCPFTSLNYNTVERRQVLEGRRRQERAMFKKLIPFILDIIEDDPSVELFWEWPRRCYGWQEPMILHLQDRLQKLGKPWHFARVDGCRYGLRSARGGFLQKAWSIGTTSSHFYHLYRSKTCPGCHEHDRIQGLETQKSAYYPWKLCKSIAQTWRQELYPDKWLTYLQAPLPSFVEPEEQLQALGLMDGALDFCPAMDLCPGLDFYPAESSSSSEPSGKELSLWRVHLMKYHRAAGHPSNYNLSRILRDAGRAPWQVRAAMDLKCDECAALKLGGSSSGKVPPASMRPMPSENPAAWKSLASFIPQRSFVDVVPEEPQEEDEDLPQLPDEPNQLPRLSKPAYRHTFKHAPKKVTFAEPSQPPEPVNAYDPSFAANPDEDDEAIGNAGIGSGIPTLEARSGSSKAKLLDSTDGQTSEPETKRPRTDDDDALLLSYLEQVDELYVLEFDMVLENDRQKRKLVYNPSLFLAQKMRDCEVRLEKLSPAHRELFRRAKLKEVNSFLANEAVRRCADHAEEQQARSSGRLMRCRWVLTWKPTPEESMTEALEELQKKGDETTLTSDGRKKAKARIVLLGFEHPDLLSEGYKTSSPVQAVLTRNLSYQMVMQEGWEIEGLDLSTAFLQTLPTEESKQLWTTGVQELRQALDLPETGVMRILKDFYGSTTAPRNLWQNIDVSLKSLGAHRIAGDPCFWLWRVPADPKTLPPHDPKDAESFKWKTLGFMAGHVDDFHRAGDLQDERWLKIRSSIDTMYKWGQLKKNEYRHAGTDLSMTTDPNYGRCLVVDQSYYIEMLEDVQIDPQRFSMTSSPLTAKEISACRASIGALQWVAVQTQPLACARCNLLLSELSQQPTMQLAQELQELIRELRKSSTVLKFFRLPKVHHWTQVYIVGLGDQAHQNRPKGGSTGGLLIFLSNRDLSIGRPAPMILVTWKTWKLKRVSIGTNDAEVQSLVETEDVLFRTRMLWASINSAGTVGTGTRADMLDASEAEVCLVPGLLGTDSKGGYDSIMVNESPMLGLSNTRAAIQAFQLKEFLPRCLTKLMWLASDWNLADCMTKKKAECRKSMEYFFQRRVWMLKFDPNFVQSSRKENASKGTPIQQMQGLHEKNSQEFCGNAVVSIHDRLARYSC
ncbi:unnamed protein product [Cladocopium goreaui]|uniref:Copia protein n=1 Tax=Cladocopium goreaui TaxID=2562237 RepID=A0A9P1FRR4_9DINO|nr:unnamed protein product [Cladocopium goreaui]